MADEAFGPVVSLVRVSSVDGVLVGDVPSFRADQMPYGGVKDSGVGREGPAAAMASPRNASVLTGLTL